MPELSFTLVLTKGTHIIGAGAAERILQAITAREPLVEIELDLFGNAPAKRSATLATAHVVALSVNPSIENTPPEARGSSIRLLPTIGR